MWARPIAMTLGQLPNCGLKDATPRFRSEDSVEWLTACAEAKAYSRNGNLSKHLRKLLHRLGGHEAGQDIHHILDATEPPLTAIVPHRFCPRALATTRRPLPRARRLLPLSGAAASNIALRPHGEGFGSSARRRGGGGVALQTRTAQLRGDCRNFKRADPCAKLEMGIQERRSKENPFMLGIIWKTCLRHRIGGR